MQSQNVKLRLVGPGTINAELIVQVWYVGNDVLQIDGGTYNAEETAFLIYGTISGYNSVTIRGATINAVTEGSSGTQGAIWVSNKGPNKLHIENTKVTSGMYGIYCGVLEEAKLSNVFIDSASTALEIKSGNIRIERCNISSDSYAEGGTVNQGGPGQQKSTVFINNAYADLIEGMTSVNVIIDDATVISNTLSSSPVLVAAPDSAEIYLSWKNCLEDVKVLKGEGKITLTSNKPLDSDTTEIESESNEVIFDIGTVPLVTDKTLTVNLSGEYGESYTVIFPAGTEISDDASVSIRDVSNSGSNERMFEVDFNDDIDTKGMEIYITLPAYGISNPYVLFVDGDEYVSMDIVDVTNGMVTFSTTHNSIYMIGNIPASDGESYAGIAPGIDTNILYIAEIVLIVLALAGLVAVIRRN